MPSLTKKNSDAMPTLDVRGAAIVKRPRTFHTRPGTCFRIFEIHERIIAPVYVIPVEAPVPIKPRMR